MSVLAFPSTRRRSAAPSFADRAWHVWHAAARSYRNWKAARALAELSDDTLHDLGITRGEIDYVAHHGRPGRP